MKSLSSKFSNNIVKIKASIHCSKIFHNTAILDIRDRNFNNTSPLHGLTVLHVQPFAENINMLWGISTKFLFEHNVRGGEISA